MRSSSGSQQGSDGSRPRHTQLYARVAVAALGWLVLRNHRWALYVARWHNPVARFDQPWS